MFLVLRYFYLDVHFSLYLNVLVQENCSIRSMPRIDSSLEDATYDTEIALLFTRCPANLREKPLLSYAENEY